MNSLPFKIQIGIGYYGLMRLEPPNVVIEFRSWSLRKMSRRIVEVRFPISEIDSVDFITPLLETRMEVQLKSMKAAGDIPCQIPGLIRLEFAQRYRDSARALSSRLNAAISEQYLEQLESEMDSIEE